MENIDFKVSTYLKEPRYILREEIEELQQYINYKRYKQEPYSDELDWEIAVLNEIYHNAPKYIWVINYIKKIPQYIVETIKNIVEHIKEKNNKVVKNNNDKDELPF